jgi:hypothetical protein
MVIPETIGPSSEAINLVTWGDHQFAVWYTLAGELRIGRIERGVQRWGIDHDEYQFAGTPRTTLALPVANDGHNIAAIAVDGLGKLHVWANMHANPMRAVATTASHDTDGWLADAGWATAVSAFSGSGNSVTYPFPCQLSDGSLIFYARAHNGATSGAGNSNIWRRASDGTVWTGPTMLFQGLAVPDAKGPGIPGDTSPDTEFNWNAYPSGPLYVESSRTPHPGRIHMCWVWRVFGLVERLNVLMSYAYSDDQGVTWHAVDGTPCTLPFTPINNLACRIPGHARINTIARDSTIVVADLDTPNHGLTIGTQIDVQVQSDPTFDGTFTVAGVGNPLPTSVAWLQAGANDSASWGYVGRDDYQNGQAVTVDDDGNPHIIVSQTDTWWVRHNGTTWEQTIIPQPLHGVTHTNAASAVWFRGDLWLLKGGTTGPTVRRPYLYNVTGNGVIVMGGPVASTGGHEPSYDREAYRRFGIIEVLTCDGNRPRVFTFGEHTRISVAA